MKLTKEQITVAKKEDVKKVFDKIKVSPAEFKTLFDDVKHTKAFKRGYYHRENYFKLKGKKLDKTIEHNFKYGNFDLAILLSIKKACDVFKTSCIKKNAEISKDTLKGLKPYLDIYDIQAYTPGKAKKAKEILIKTLIKFVKYLPEFWE